jgi:hypothetical protein
LELYAEGTEALFWDDVRECANVCRWALDHEEERKRIAAAGQRRNIANEFRNEAVMREILGSAFADS